MAKQYTLHKQERIYLSKEIETLFSHAHSFVIYPFRVIWKAVPFHKSHTKVFISVPKRRLRHAVDRNRIKRCTREAFRLNRTALHELNKTKGLTSLVGVIYIAENKVASSPMIKEAITQALKRIELLQLSETSDKQPK